MMVEERLQRLEEAVFIKDKPNEKSKKEAKPSKRGKSKYNIHIGECMKKDNTMKECAVEWRAIKKNNPEKKEGDKNGSDINEGVLAGCESITMLSSLGCSNCQDMKEAFKEEIDKGEIKVRSVDYGVGKRLVGELGVDAVPSFVCEIEGMKAKEIKGLDVAKKFGKEGI